MSHNVQGAAKKWTPKVFRRFLSNSSTFLYEILQLYLRKLLHVNVKQNMILLKNDKVIDFLIWPPTDFSALKMIKLKM